LFLIYIYIYIYSDNDNDDDDDDDDYCDAHYAYLLSFLRYNNLLIEKLYFLPLLLTALSFKATAKELPLGFMV